MFGGLAWLTLNKPFWLNVGTRTLPSLNLGGGTCVSHAQAGGTARSQTASGGYIHLVSLQLSTQTLRVGS